MKLPPARTLLGVAAMLFGILWIGSVLVQPAVRVLTEKKELSDYIFVLTMLPVLSLPGVFAAYFGFRLMRETAPRNIKGLVGCFAVFAVFWLSSRLDQLFCAHVHETLGTTLFTFLTTIVIIPLYFS